MSGQKKAKTNKVEVELRDLISVLHQCVGTLNDVADNLQEAAARFNEFHRKNANVQGGAS
jgi:hypothetical protein